MSNCPICNSEATSHSPGGLDGEVVSCHRCGNYQISRTASVNLRRPLADDARKVANASGWIREHGNILITSEIADDILNLPTPRVPERATRLLRYLEKETHFLGESFHLNMGSSHQKYLGAAWSINWQELHYLFGYLSQQGYVSFSSTDHRIIQNLQVTPSGFAFLEQLKYANKDSQIGFCAMWFSDCIKPVWKGYIEPAIRDAGYEPKRIDEHQHNNRIDDEIIAQIRQSKFVIADFTGQRGGVYFEAGFALGLGLPVIWTCREKELRRVHFDNRQYNFVTWEESSLTEFKLNLQYRIEATLGRGTWKPST